MTCVVFGEGLEGGVAVDTRECVVDCCWRRRGTEERGVLVGAAERDEPQKMEEDKGKSAAAVTVVVAKEDVHCVGAD